MHRIGAFIASLALAVAGLASPAAAAPPSPGPGFWTVADVQRQVDDKMRLAPGGRKVGQNKIVWEKRGVTMEFAMPGQTRGPGSCPYLYSCLYGDWGFNDGADVTPWQLSFYYCSLEDLGNWGVRNQASSVVNNQTAGTRTWLHRYRNESVPSQGYIQLWMAPAYHADEDLTPSNDVVDLIDPC